MKEGYRVQLGTDLMAGMAGMSLACLPGHI